jgi:hypothetical protein
MRIFTKLIFLFCIGLTACGCNSNVQVKEIRIGLHNDNRLQIQVNVKTDRPATVYAEYWKQKEGEKFASDTSVGKTDHKLVLCNISPETDYAYQIITEKDGKKMASKTYAFKSEPLPMFLQEQFKADSAKHTKLPPGFNDGLMLVNKRYAPGVAFLVDKKGVIRWYHMLNASVGFKVVHFTKWHTIIGILGGNNEPTSYGHEILEVNLLGDTILDLKKGQNDFKQTIHHEILKNDKGQLVTIYVDNRVTDLSAIGGKKKDTVSGDGIMVMDKTGKKLWGWSVFDAIDPLKDPHLLKTKKDWMHANSLNYDTDGNYLLSFYNSGQIWKIDAKTGKVLWKFGKGGNFGKPAECDFTQAHAVHINPQGNLMFFDNGVEKNQSGVFALKLDEKHLTSTLDMHIKLPKEVFNGRMGSAYLMDDTTVLVCCSKRHIVLLADRKGNLLWTMETAMPTYRAEFIPYSQLAPYIKP